MINTFTQLTSQFKLPDLEKNHSVFSQKKSEPFLSSRLYGASEFIQC